MVFGFQLFWGHVNYFCTQCWVWVCQTWVCILSPTWMEFVLDIHADQEVESDLRHFNYPFLIFLLPWLSSNHPGHMTRLFLTTQVVSHRDADCRCKPPTILSWPSLQPYIGQTVLASLLFSFAQAYANNIKFMTSVNPLTCIWNQTVWSGPFFTGRFSSSVCSPIFMFSCLKLKY